MSEQSNQGHEVLPANDKPTKVNLGSPSKDVAELLAGIQAAAEVDAETNYRIARNHFNNSDRVIMNLAALKDIQQSGTSLEKLLEVAAANPQS